MADVPASIQERRPARAGVAGEGFRLLPEPSLGMIKVQLYGGEGEAELAGACGGDLPQASRYVDLGGDCMLAWLAPGEWLLAGPDPNLRELGDRVAAALGGTLFLVTDLRHARASFLLTGSMARNRLAAGCPLDLRDRAFPVGATARSLFGEAGLFLARFPDENNAARYRLVVDQTMAGYLQRLIALP